MAIDDIQQTTGHNPLSSKPAKNSEAKQTIRAAKSTIDGLGEGTNQTKQDTRGRKSNEEKAALEQQKADIERQMKMTARLFDPKSWRAVVSAPANIMLAKTGDAKTWDLPDDEVDAMAESLAMSVETWVQIDPKYVCLVLLLTNVAMTYGTRFLTHKNKNAVSHAQ